MTRKEVRDFVELGINAITPVLHFNSGRISEFNSEKEKKYPYCWLESLSVQTDPVILPPLDTWNIVIHVAKKDKAGSLPVQYEEIIDECDYIAQQLVHKYNAIVAGYQLVTLASISRDPFHHKLADDTSGVVLSFALINQDKTNLC